MAKKKKRKQHTATDLPIILDYEGEPMSVYDPITMMPYSEPPLTERTRFKTEAFAEDYGILLKEDTELKNYLMTLVISSVNKLLKAERQIQEKKNP